MSTESTDQQLLDAHAQHRSPDAFRVIVERHAPWVFAAAFRQLHDQHLAEDAAQIVFLLLHRRPHLMHSPPKLSGWLFNAVQFTVKNMRRDQRRRHWRERRIAAQLDSASTDPAQTTELHDQLDTAVAKLSAADRNAVLLRFYQEFPFDQVAAALHVSEPAARKRVTRAVNALRQHLGMPTDALSVSSLLLAATHGLPQAPSTLAASITAAPSAGALATLKGVTTLMALAKLQTAAIIAVAALIVLIPVSMVAYHRLPPTQTTPVTAPTTPTTTAPDDYFAWYALQPGEALKLVTDAPSEARTAFLAQGDPTRQPPPSGQFITIRWDKDRPYPWGYGDGMPLLDILEVYMDVYPQTLTANLALPPNTPKAFINYDHTVSLPSLRGDLLIRANATPEQFRASLETLLTQSLGHPVTLSFRDVTEKALVLRGNWQYTPNSLHAHPPVRGLPVVEIYGATLDNNLNRGILADGSKDYFEGHLGAWLREPVIIECDGFPSAVCAHFSSEFINNPQSHDKTLVLNHLTGQTGRTWTEEPRTVRHLFIETAAP